MITVKNALERVLESVSPLGIERVDILRAQGKILGEDICSPRNIPPKDNSAMDGYALRIFPPAILPSREWAGARPRE
jgi:molybdopterin molybdotransferase